MLKQIQNDLQNLKNPEKMRVMSGFFKTGKGEYGEGDIFLGITVPEQREVAKKYPNLTLQDLKELLFSQIHEYRLTALFILIAKFKKANLEGKKEIYEFYMKNLKYINNWDLIDTSAPNIPGVYLLDKDKSILYKLARSKDIWEKRVAMLSTYAFIRNNQFEDTIKIAEIMLHDTHDLIHKAVGWMLREVGNRNMKAEEAFLIKYYKEMPRTMLRYAIEKFPPEKKKFYIGK